MDVAAGARKTHLSNRYTISPKVGSHEDIWYILQTYRKEKVYKLHILVHFLVDNIGRRVRVQQL
jgi:hypothetical protein